jgi:hypothetical protein
LEKIRDIELDVKKAVEHFKEELGKIDVDVVDWGFNMAKIEGGVCVSGLVKINIIKK